jgi:hypothetical protein
MSECEERDELLRSLDVEKFQAFWRKHNLPMPAGDKWAAPGGAVDHDAQVPTAD